MEDVEPSGKRESYPALFRRFLRFGLLAWGGPIPQIAMIRQELVEEEGWISRERFNRVLGLYQALPGPEAHELCVYFGMIARGRFGGFLAGLGFMLPGFLLMFALSWFYLTYGLAIPHFSAAFHGLQAAVGALILRALHRIGGHSLKDATLWALAAMALLGEVIGIHFLLTLILAGLINSLIKRKQRLLALGLAGVYLAALFFLWQYPQIQAVQAMGSVPHEVQGAASMVAIFISGLKSGLFTFGGAYTVIAFLQHDAVQVQAWLTNAQFLDGLALSGILPAPLIIFSTFVGFVAGGSPGALIMTVAIFLPAFSFTLVAHGLLERIIDNDRVHALLDGVTAAVVGLMTWTTVNLLRAAIDDWTSLGIGAGALLAICCWHSKWAVIAVMIVAAAVGIIIQ
ncbi:MAG: chromate efflux transporter [Syntrophobacteraceae bacterium]